MKIIVQVCAFLVECNVTRDLTVDFLLYMSIFLHVSTCQSRCVFHVRFCGIHVDLMRQYDI